MYALKRRRRRVWLMYYVTLCRTNGHICRPLPTNRSLLHRKATAQVYGTWRVEAEVEFKIHKCSAIVPNCCVCRVVFHGHTAGPSVLR